MDPRSVRSLDVLLDLARHERGLQLQHLDALDGRAGILLGFAGALIALTPVGSAPLLNVGRLLSVVAGFFALAVFWPRTIPQVNLVEARQHYLSAAHGVARLALLDAQVEMVGVSRSILRSKSRRLQVSMVSLGMASSLTAVAVAIR
jgi:hypothetical protein